MNRKTILSNCTPALPKHARAHIAAPRRRAPYQNAKHLKTQVVAFFRMQYVDASDLSMCLHQCITGSTAQVQCRRCFAPSFAQSTKPQPVGWGGSKVQREITVNRLGSIVLTLSRKKLPYLLSLVRARSRASEWFLQMKG